LVIIKTAKALGLTSPPSLRARADQVMHHDERGLAKARLLIRAFPDRMRLALARVPGARLMWRTVKRTRGRLAGALIPIMVELADTILIVMELANATC
jgi:hypothetical protein